MNESRILDRLILADLCVSAAALRWSSLLQSPKPPAPITILWVTVCAATAVSWIGLLSRIRVARVLYAATWVGYLALVIVRGETATSPVGTLLDLLTGLVGGMILALLFFSKSAGFAPGSREAASAS